MATIAECEEAFRELAARLATVDTDTPKPAVVNRTVSCTLRDLDIVFAARLQDGHLQDIKQVERPDAQLRLSVTSDDLIALTDGSLAFTKAWTSGRLRIEANMFRLCARC